jgi:hypothetical protein
MTSRRPVRALPSPARVASASRGLGAPLALAALGILASMVVAAPLPARADDLRPAYLQLVERDDDTWDVSWKVPAIDETTTLAIRPEFPPGTELVAPARRAWAEGTAVLGWTVRVPGGLAGRRVAIPGLSSSRTEVIARIVHRDGSEHVERVTPAAPELAIGMEPGSTRVARTYGRLGVEHILGSLDHLLFLLSLCLLVGEGRRLVATITAFTLAHSITLGLAALGVLDVPRPPIEAAIALSIAFVAAEIVRSARGGPGAAERRPWLLAFAFGLLHGLGFAAALAEVGLPRASIPLALLFFNLGVEAGQLAFVVIVFAVRRLAGALAPRLRWSSGAALRVGAAYAIGAVASAWLFERVAGFWRAG